MSLIEVKNLSKLYGSGEAEITALKNINLNIEQGEFVAIVGPSGSGKSTLLNIIGGLDRYDSGDLIINGISTKNIKIGIGILIEIILLVLYSKAIT